MLMNRSEAVVVDIRSADDFAKGHIIAAVSLPPGGSRQSAGQVTQAFR